MNDIEWNDIERFIDTPQPFYAQIMLTVVRQTPLLAADRLARQVVMGIDATRARAPGELWVYTVLPDSARLIVGPTLTAALDDYIDALKAATAERVLARIRQSDDGSLDVVLHYNPVRGAPIYRVWEAGYHATVFTSAYRLSNAIYHIQQLPVQAELVTDAHDWPHTWVGGDA